MTAHIHLDVVGGVSGDMFLAAMLSAFPEHEAGLSEDLATAGLLEHVTLKRDTIKKSGFAATQVTFEITETAPATRHWRNIKGFIEACALSEETKRTAIEIFAQLAEAEAICHGVSVDDVHFHEVADWDSLADIIGAAALLTRIGTATWSCSSLPIGSGLVQSQHGKIPVPAPATAHLLKGFDCFDDGALGERITPTGAAILKFLNPAHQKSSGKLTRIGTGAGQKSFKNIPNILRVLVLESSDTIETTTDWVTQISFEIDDMTPEEIATSAEHIRAHQGVIDVGFTQGFGKKSRPNYGFRVLTTPDAGEDVATLCFNETSTIGLRIETVARRILSRQHGQSGNIAIKVVERPSGPSAKAESDDLAAFSGLEQRRALASNATKGDSDE
ncbi:MULTISPECIES: nickel pincer cofactor biosynthesis protein LarC [Halocynthiibacter]|uniref:Nickel pincer cofactor biosynthesis protein LarC n=1 Tax=Halocynthiibacter halioticoli TaxID=2986804 RepID=A0AAE3LUK2_9RHOB|nr:MULTISPECIES: nickel pincer cofactor biosynthesis protein LarC [Halocynthiibacter]MCV6824490.1 nickel pincer cofactor biosynthesis protein LarC [Halocynthiibacter halioticoli]MCW4057491.1 nickel pincer cofactor biosynthesis protein LarC [Halocynthiibacter sp. SDUM655004]